MRHIAWLYKVVSISLTMRRLGVTDGKEQRSSFGVSAVLQNVDEVSVCFT